jgi:hypothetical protein
MSVTVHSVIPVRESGDRKMALLKIIIILGVVMVSIIMTGNVVKFVNVAPLVFVLRCGWQMLL